MKHTYLFSIIFGTLFLTLNFTEVHGQYSLSDLSLGEKVVEIKTYSGRTYRGWIVEEVEGVRIVLMTRNGTKHTILENDIAERVKVLGDRRDFGKFSDYGVSYVNRQHIPESNYGIGYSLGMGIEFHNDIYLYVPFDFIFGEFSSDDLYFIYTSFHVTAGYRFNRDKKITHSLSAGPGISMYFSEMHIADDDNLNLFSFSFNIRYDVEFEVGSRFSLVPYVQLQNQFSGSFSGLFIGLCLRTYLSSAPVLPSLR